MLARTLALLAALALAARPSAAQEKPLRLDHNIPALKLVVYEGDVPIRTYPVAVGMKGHDTPTGSFKISRAEWNPWWRPPEREWAKDDKITPPGPENPMGRVKMFFMPYYFIHGSPAQESIGSPASHGCVRMLNKDAIALAKLLHERAAPQVSEKTIDRFLANSKQTREVPFKTGIPLTIRYDPVVVEDGKVRVYPDFYGYHAVHTEAVYQALLAAGYDVSGVDHADVQKLLKRASTAKGAYTVSVEEAFGEDVGRSLAARSVEK
jgi:murein L,D-transpeptidase YcbB/YkuD